MHLEWTMDRMRALCTSNLHNKRNVEKIHNFIIISPGMTLQATNGKLYETPN